MFDNRDDNDLLDFVKKIGEGGQADVFLLRQRKTGFVYAGKFLREAWDPIAREMFRQEAARQARVAGANVVRIFATYLDSEKPYFIMEYLPNGSLLDELRKRRVLSARDALMNARQVAEALDDLHRRNVVHRDVKPGNIMRNRDGRLILNDLGLAATLSRADVVHAPGFVGTRAYAAPEQTKGLATFKSDVYSLGVVLREMLTGSVEPQLIGGAHLAHLVGIMTDTNMSQRPSAYEVVQLIDRALSVELAQPVAGRSLFTPLLTTAAAHVPVAMSPLQPWVPPARVVPAAAVPARVVAAAPAQAAGGGWGGIIAGVLGVLATFAIASSGERATWDAAVGRYRDRNGRFTSG